MTAQLGIKYKTLYFPNIDMNLLIESLRLLHFRTNFEIFYKNAFILPLAAQYPNNQLVVAYKNINEP